MNLTLKPIAEAPKDRYLLVFGQRNPLTKQVHVCYSQFDEKRNRWSGFPETHPPKWFADLSEVSCLLE